jgi:creatinine amidohydrolase
MSALVEYHLLRPKQMIERRNAVPVAYMGLGILEWHGLHNPLGLDGVKANGVACYLARELGGLVMPPQYWGEYRKEIAELEFDGSFRVPFSTDLDDCDHTKPITNYLGIEKQAFIKDAERGKNYGEYELWEKLLLKTLFQIETLGFKAIVLVPGHYPLFRSVDKVIKQYISEGGSCKILKLSDFSYERDGYSGDHAAAFETSITMALYPELVDLNELDDDLSKPNIGVIGRDPRVHASKEYGDLILQRFSEITKEFIDTVIINN